MIINYMSTSMGTQVYQNLMSIFLFSYAVGTRQIPTTQQGGALPLFVFFSITWFLGATLVSPIKMTEHECLRLGSCRALSDI